MKGWTLDQLHANPKIRVVEQGKPRSAEPVEAKPKRRQKFNAKKVEYNGHIFDSVAECERFKSLEYLERARVIRGLGRQPVFALNGASGKAVSRYVADFLYIENGRTIVEDVKGFATPTFRLKRKLFLEQYPEHELRVCDAKGRAKRITARYPAGMA